MPRLIANAMRAILLASANEGDKLEGLALSWCAQPSIIPSRRRAAILGEEADAGLTTTDIVNGQRLHKRPGVKTRIDRAEDMTAPTIIASQQNNP